MKTQILGPWRFVDMPLNPSIDKNTHFVPTVSELYHWCIPYVPREAIWQGEEKETTITV